MKKKELRLFAKSFHRLIAFMIDMIILSIVGFLISLFFRSQLSSIGAFGRIVGFIIAGLYFCILESNTGFGQTIGKKIIGIKVVNQQGFSLDLKTSIIRYSIWAICYFINGIAFTTSKYENLLASISSIILFGLGSALIYMFIFNRGTRQSIHDVITKAYVIPINRSNEKIEARTNKGHLYVAGILPIIVFGIFFILVFNSSSSTDIKNLTSIRSIIIEQEAIRNAGVTEGKTKFKSIKGEVSETTFIKVKALNNQNFDSGKSLTLTIAEIVLKNKKDALNKDRIIISISSGYDIGIWSQNTTYSISHTPKEWENLIDEKSDI